MQQHSYGAVYYSKRATVFHDRDKKRILRLIEKNKTKVNYKRLCHVFGTENNDFLYLLQKVNMRALIKDLWLYIGQYKLAKFYGLFTTKKITTWFERLCY